MTKRMLIDATHAEETRVVVLDGTRLEDFDVETSTKKQIKGNIYLAKVIRVEPSLQAAFVEYGGNRHGFLAFSEIHPDYYQIPVADRQRLLEAEAAEARAEAEAEAAEDAAQEQAASGASPAAPRHPIISEFDAIEPAFEAAAEASEDEAPDTGSSTEGPVPSGSDADEAGFEPAPSHPVVTSEVDVFEPAFEASEAATADEASASDDGAAEPEPSETPRPRAQAIEMVREIVIGSEPPAEETAADAAADEIEGESRFVAAPAAPEESAEDTNEEPAPETFGGTDPTEENGVRRSPPRFARNYKIQEVIHRRQIMLIQVVKEERGTKGAALTTYLSLAGRYCVLMPNSPRGGGVSRKITSVSDRKRLREVIKEVDMPAGMGLIVRTAGANRPKPEIRRDCEYLLRLWDDIREHTLKSVAPALIYEEASLIKRAIRDGYTRDIEEVLVDGEPGWKAARDFMRMLTPQHASKVQLWRGSDMSLFAKQGVEAQLDAMLSPTVQLKSGGYLVINQTEALVAIDVNSGRSTRERNIEETALRTNLEAADEAARQLRLRDLAGLIVIDFIDMEGRKHNAMVERRLKDALKNDRARIQVGTISHFGLMEMSRQRLRPSLAETAFITCPHCLGTGTVRSVESSAIHVLRAIEDEGVRRRSAEIHVYVAGAVAMYILNQKRERLMAIERTHGLQVILLADDKLVPPQIRLEKIRPYVAAEAPAHSGALIGGPIAMDYASREESEAGFEDEDRPVRAAAVPQARIAAPADEADAASAVADPAVAGEVPVPTADAVKADDQGERGRRRRRRRRRGGRREENGDSLSQAATNGGADGEGDSEGDEFEPWNGEGEPDQGVAAADPTPAPGEPAVPPVPVPGPGPELPEEPGRGPELPPPNGPEPELPGEPGEPGPDIMPPIGPSPEMPQPVAFGESEGRGRSRRGRRGGRGRSGRVDEGDVVVAPVVPAYRGPTPADPYAGQIDALFAVMDPDAEPELPAPAAAVSRGAVLAAPAPEAPEVAATIAEVPVPEAPVFDEAPVIEAPVVEPPLALDAEVTAEAVPAVTETEALVSAPTKPARASRARKPKVVAPAAPEPAVPEPATPVDATADATPLAEVRPAEVLPTEAKPARRRAASRAKAPPAAAPTPEASPAVVETASADAAVARAPALEPVSLDASVPEVTPGEPSPVIKPIVIGVDAPAVSKRQGWWKR
jgi:ribonuclease E